MKRPARKGPAMKRPAMKRRVQSGDGSVASTAKPAVIDLQIKDDESDLCGTVLLKSIFNMDKGILPSGEVRISIEHLKAAGFSTFIDALRSLAPNMNLFTSFTGTGVQQSSGRRRRQPIGTLYRLKTGMNSVAGLNELVDFGNAIAEDPSLAAVTMSLTANFVFGGQNSKANLEFKFRSVKFEEKLMVLVPSAAKVQFSEVSGLMEDVVKFLDKNPDVTDIKIDIKDTDDEETGGSNGPTDEDWESLADAVDRHYNVQYITGRYATKFYRNPCANVFFDGIPEDITEEFLNSQGVGSSLERNRFGTRLVAMDAKLNPHGDYDAVFTGALSGEILLTKSLSANCETNKFESLLCNAKFFSGRSRVIFKSSGKPVPLNRMLKDVIP